MKTFKQFIEEEAPTVNTTAVPGAGDDSETVIVRKKRERPITKHYIEIMGKRKKREK